MISDTSRAAYRSLDLNDGQRKVMAWFHRQPAGAAFTRAEVARGSGILLQSVCGRCAELIPLGFLEELPPRACKVTGNQSHALRIRSTGESCPSLTASVRTRDGDRPAVLPRQEGMQQVAHPKTAAPQFSTATVTAAPSQEGVGQGGNAAAAARIERHFGRDYYVVNEGIEDATGVTAATLRPAGRAG